jgi:hypothetical protein
MRNFLSKRLNDDDDDDDDDADVMMYVRQSKLARSSHLPESSVLLYFLKSSLKLVAVIKFLA